MNIDDLVQDSFFLDFEILRKNLNKIDNLNLINTLKIDQSIYDKNLELFLINAKEAIYTLTDIFEKCNDQRKKFRVFLIKILKEKQLVDKLIKAENNEMISNKLLLHDELKAKVIDYKNKMICSQNQEILKMKENSKKSITIHNTVIDNLAKSNKIKSKSNSKRKNGSHYCSKDKFLRQANQKMKKKSKLNNSDLRHRSMISLDFNNEIYDIISSSPINSPKNLPDQKIDESRLITKEIKFHSNTKRYKEIDSEKKKSLLSDSFQINETDISRNDLNFLYENHYEKRNVNLQKSLKLKNSSTNNLERIGYEKTLLKKSNFEDLRKSKNSSMINSRDEKKKLESVTQNLKKLSINFQSTIKKGVKIDKKQDGLLTRNK